MYVEAYMMLIFFSDFLEINANILCYGGGSKLLFTYFLFKPIHGSPNVCSKTTFTNWLTLL